MKKFLIGGGIFVLVAFIATGVALLKYTQVEWWIPAGAAAVIAIVTIPLTAMLRAKRKRKTGFPALPWKRKELHLPDDDGSGKNIVDKIGEICDCYMILMQQPYFSVFIGSYHEAVNSNFQHKA